MLKRILSSFFVSKTPEQKLIYEKSIEVSNDLCLPSDLKEFFLKTIIVKNEDLFIQKIKENEKPLEGWLNLSIFNIIKNKFVSGMYHCAPGMIDPGRFIEWETMIQALENCVKYEIYTQKEANNIMANIRQICSEI